MLLCVHPSLSLCVCVRALVHVSACIFIMHAWPEAAVLDCSWYGPETNIGHIGVYESLGELIKCCTAVVPSKLTATTLVCDQVRENHPLRAGVAELPVRRYVVHTIVGHPGQD